jgi:hypothetical protein
MGQRAAFGDATQYIKGSRIGPVHIFDRAGTVQRVAPGNAGRSPFRKLKGGRMSK